jgi:hypothetical protein
MKSLSTHYNIINPAAHRAYEDAETLSKIYNVLDTLFIQKFGFNEPGYIYSILNNPYKK